MSKPILISGAGLASLLFAQSLRRASLPFLIFERDAAPTFRAQGYRLRLSAQGLDAIESVLDPQAFQTFWDACGKTNPSDSSNLNALTGTAEDSPPKQSNTPPRPGNAPLQLQSRGGKVVGASRGDMRRMFMSGCEPFIHWAHTVTGYERTPSGVHAIFADGSKSVEGSMLVAGDGMHSKIAKKLSHGKLKVYDTGARGIHGQAPTPAFKDLGEGVWRVVDDSRPQGKVFIITNVRPGDMDNPDIDFGWTMGAQPGVIQPPNDDDAIVGEAAAKIARALTEKWHPRLRPLFEQMKNSEAAFWKITCSTPTGVPEWENEPRVTVIGDAVHSMTPAGGMGANTALRDSALLGKLINDAGGFADTVTSAYEKEMRVYASETVRLSYGMAKAQFGILLDENSPSL